MSTQMVIRILVAVAYGIIAGLIVIPVSMKLIKSRDDDPLKASILKKPIIKITYIAIGVLVSVAFALTAKSDMEFARNLLLLIPIYAISTVDALIRKIPNPLLIAMLVIQLAFLIYTSITEKNMECFITAAFGLGFGLIVCTLPSLLKIPMGNGDIKYSAVIGCIISLVGYIQSMVIMALLVLIFYVVLKVKKKGDMRTQIPMGPFLSIGTVITMCFPLATQYLGNIF